MPYTTPYLPLTASAPEPASSSPLLAAPRPLHARQSSQRASRTLSGASSSSSSTSSSPSPTAHLHAHADRTLAASASSSPPAAAQDVKTDAVRPSTERRRSTLTSRFPLLRKSSREPATPSSSSTTTTTNTSTASSALPSFHIRGSSISANFLPASAAPYVPQSTPRASSSSFSRGRSEQGDVLRSRDPSANPSTPSLSHEPSADNLSVHSTTPLRSAASSASISNSYTSADPAKPAPVQSRASSVSSAPRKIPDKKMHQTSSRLLRMTDDERPFTRCSPIAAERILTLRSNNPKRSKSTKRHSILNRLTRLFISSIANPPDFGKFPIKDFKDLFATLMVSLPLTAHRVRFRMIDYTFTSDEAITNLGSLKFSQSNRMPDPKDSSRVVTTTTTTTFSMAKEMARSVCAKFLEAKFIESVEGKIDFQNKSAVWQLTPKGIHILERFCSRNGIQSAHVKHVIDSQRNPHILVILERDTETDKLHHDEQTVEIIFRRFVGSTANEVSTSDSDSIHEFSKCDVGVRMVKHKATASRPYEHTFTGKSTVDWLMDCCTMVDRREGNELGQLFVELRLIAPVDQRQEKFIPSKQSHYYVTQHGEQVAGWMVADESSAAADSNNAKVREGATRDSNSNRTNVIIRNPSWRLLYREFLKETMCEENLSFYLEVQDFNSQYKAAVNSSGDHKIETIRETLAAAYGLYNAFLAPGSPNELNIDHALRTQLATRMTRAVGDDAAMMQSLVEVALLFEKAQNSIFKLMSSDSVPKFIKHPKYGPQLRGLDAAAAQAYAASSGSRA